MKRLICLLSLLFGLLSAPAVQAQALGFLTITPESSQRYSSGLPPMPGWVDAKLLSANVSETFTVPSGANWVTFGTTCNFYVKNGATAAVPSDTADGTASAANPRGYSLFGITQFSVIAEAACKVTASYYK